MKTNTRKNIFWVALAIAASANAPASFADGPFFEWIASREYQFFPNGRLHDNLPNKHPYGAC